MLSPLRPIYNSILPSVSSPTICNSETSSFKTSTTAPGEAGTPVRRIVHTAVNKQKLYHCIQTLNLYEDHIDELLKQTTAELDKELSLNCNALQKYANLNITSPV